MFMIQFLRMCSDLCFLLAPVGMIAMGKGAGAAQMFYDLLVLCAGYAGTCALQEKEKHRFLQALSVLLGVSAAVLPGILSGNTADTAVSVIASLYVLLVLSLHRTKPDRERQVQNLLILAVILALAGLICLSGGDVTPIRQVGLPLFLLDVLTTLLLLRKLRLPESVYTDRGFQKRNALMVAVPLLAAVGLALPGVRYALGAALRFLWLDVVVPVLYLIFLIVYAVCYGIFTLLSFLIPDEKITFPTMDTPAEEFSGAMESYGQTQAQEVSPFLLLLRSLLPFLVLALAVYLLYRFLSRKGTSSPLSLLPEQKKEAASAPDRSERKRGRGAFSGRGEAQRVRAAYRKYLKYCRKAGVTLKKDMTSLEIGREEAGKNPETSRQAGELREIYLRTRYDGNTLPEDAARAEELVRQIRAAGLSALHAKSREEEKQENAEKDGTGAGTE